MAFRNVYEDAARAEAYSRLEFHGTYYLAYRDLPALIKTHVSGRQALDFGCGAGRSTRFLRALGFAVLGVDVSEDMIARAREIDPAGDYRGLAGADLIELSGGPRDLVLSAFTFDNVAQPRKLGLLRELRALLSASGRVVNLVSAPEIYTHEWASFSTRDFPANRDARTGDIVRIVITDTADRRPVEDVLCTADDYGRLYRAAGLEVVQSHSPLARDDEPFAWVNETRIAPWRIDVLEAA
jgi:trans-aconitate methyltransferase